MAKYPYRIRPRIDCNNEQDLSGWCGVVLSELVLSYFGLAGLRHEEDETLIRPPEAAGVVPGAARDNDGRTIGPNSKGEGAVGALFSVA